METVIGWLQAYKYLAMFGILFVSGLGVPIPEEVTLLASGLFVGWGEADYWIASACCVAGILAGDTMVFYLGRFQGRNFLRLILSEKRLHKAALAFRSHRLKTVFFARFVAGLRVGVYGYAGAQRMRWLTFITLDLTGALISGPTSLWIGKFAAEKMGSPEQAIARAQELSQNFHALLLFVVALVVAVLVIAGVYRWLNRKMLEDDSPTGSGKRPQDAADRPGPPSGAARQEAGAPDGAVRPGVSGPPPERPEG